MPTFLAVAAVAAVVIGFALSLIRKQLYNTLLAEMREGNYPSFYRHVDSSTYRFFFTKDRLLELKLNAAMAEGKKKKVQKLLDEIESLKLKPDSREKLNMKAFNFFLASGDKKAAKTWLDKVNQGKNGQMILEANRIYNIFVLKNDKDLKALLSEMENLPEASRGIHEYLLSVIYENRGDKETSDKYARLSETHLAQVDAQTEKKLNKGTA